MLAKSTGGTAANYAAMARKSASRGSKHYVHVDGWEDRPRMMFRHQRGRDNVFAEWRPYRRVAWMWHDIRAYGLWEYTKKFYYGLESWRGKASEKHLHGIDELGNKYWSAWDTKGCGSGHKMGRFFEPKDQHPYRGLDTKAPPPIWEAWLRGMIAHTPQQMQARGEYGPHGRVREAAPYKWHYADWHLWHNDDNPGYLPTQSNFMSPWYRTVKEAGFIQQSDYNWDPHFKPFEQPHDFRMEVVESFYDRMGTNRQNFRAVDGTEWGEVGTGMSGHPGGGRHGA